MYCTFVMYQALSAFRISRLSNQLICKQANKFSNKSKYRKVSADSGLKCFENRQDGDLN